MMISINVIYPLGTFFFGAELVIENCPLPFTDTSPPLSADSDFFS